MKLYFLRHADAQPGADDAARELTPKGERQCAQLGEFLRDNGTVFDAAYTSPLVRAQQTARLVLEQSNRGHGISIEIVKELSNECGFEEFFKWLSKIPDANKVLLTGHAPTMGARACAMLGIADAEAMEMPKASLICVETDNRIFGALKYFVTPKALGF